VQGGGPQKEASKESLPFPHGSKNYVDGNVIPVGIFANSSERVKILSMLKEIIFK
jgi:hypothetical protein